MFDPATVALAERATVRPANLTREEVRRLAVAVVAAHAFFETLAPESGPHSPEETSEAELKAALGGPIDVGAIALDADAEHTEAAAAEGAPSAAAE